MAWAQAGRAPTRPRLTKRRYRPSPKSDVDEQHAHESESNVDDVGRSELADDFGDGEQSDSGQADLKEALAARLVGEFLGRTSDSTGYSSSTMERSIARTAPGRCCFGASGVGTLRGIDRRHAQFRAL